MQETMQYMGPYLPYIIAMACIFAVGFGLSLVFMKKGANAYLAKYPDAAKLWTEQKNMVVANSQIIVESIDGEAPSLFVGGVYVKPGVSHLVVKYDFSRVGVLYKSVNKSTGSTDIEVDLKPRGEYVLYFDKAEGFKIKAK